MTTATQSERPPLTERQAAFLAFIRQYRAEHGYPPSFREIGDALEIRSPNGVQCHVRSLCKKGYLAYSPFTNRTLRLVDDTPDDATTRTLADALEVIRAALHHADPALRGMLREMIRNRNLEV